MMKFLPILFLLVGVSCADNALGEKYLYERDFALYYKELTGENLASIDSEYLMVIPLSSCNLCVDEAISNVTKKSYPVDIILVGEGNQHQELDIEQMQANYKVIHDLQSLLYSYATNIGKPNLISFGKPCKQFTLQVDSWNAVDAALLGQ